MAFTKTSDSIMITATLTEKGKKLLSRGRFKIAKFALGDDEIDYRLFNAQYKDDEGYKPALLKTEMFEAFKDTHKNLQYGLNSYDSGILYLTDDQIRKIAPYKHAFIEYLPVLKINNKTSYSPTLRNDRYYVSVNDETTKIINDGVPNFKFLRSNDFDIAKLVIESGIINSGTSEEGLTPTRLNRERMIVKKFLLDKDFIVYADNRFVLTIAGILKTSRFENFASGEAIINFATSEDSIAISLENEFEYFATYPIPTIPDLIAQYDTETGTTPSTSYSALAGPRGSVSAFNVKVDNELKVNSTGTRDERFSQFGTLNNTTFSEISSSKFDYIDTTIYVIGVTSNSRLQIPIRIIRYAGT
tara:strand:- start:5895 stop:6971 length:1077 start_codon:yes stop_codon:yes gene_type:complete